MGEVLMHPIDGAGSDAATVNGHTVESNVPADAKFTDTTYPVFAGATASENGTTGLVPEPTIEDADKYLCGDGTWKTVSGGTGTSDSPVEVPITKTTNVINGTIVVYKIGHLLQIYGSGLSVKSDPGYASARVCSIPNVDGFTLGFNAAIWTAIDLADGTPIVSGSGLVSAEPDGPNIFDVFLIGVSGSSQYGVYFSLTVPLLDKKEE